MNNIIIECSCRAAKEVLESDSTEICRLNANIELLQEDLKEAYLYILAVKEYNQNDYGRGDLITKARQYLHLEV